MMEQIITGWESEFIGQASALLSARIQDAIAAHGSCILGLSGGSTPKPIYEALGEDPSIDWSKVTVFLVDDRFVPADDDNSNQLLVKKTLLLHAKIPTKNICFPDTSLPLEECIQDYDKRLSALLEDHPADVVTLGMGDDGHIASLFPPLTDAAFTGTAIHTTTPSTGSPLRQGYAGQAGQAPGFAVHDRISVTMPILMDAASAFFFLKGAAKKKVWGEMMAAKQGPNRWPAKALFGSDKATVLVSW